MATLVKVVFGLLLTCFLSLGGSSCIRNSGAEKNPAMIQSELSDKTIEEMAKKTAPAIIAEIDRTARKLGISNSDASRRIELRTRVLNLIASRQSLLETDPFAVTDGAFILRSQWESALNAFARQIKVAGHTIDTDTCKMPIHTKLMGTRVRTAPISGWLKKAMKRIEEDATRVIDGQEVGDLKEGRDFLFIDKNSTAQSLADFFTAVDTFSDLAKSEDPANVKISIGAVELLVIPSSMDGGEKVSLIAGLSHPLEPCLTHLGPA